MIIYISMMVVVAIAFLLQQHQTNLAKASGYSVKTSKILAGAVFAYIIFWTGIRDAFVDTAAYILQFQNIQISHLSELDFTFGSGWGFEVLQIFFKTFISSNYHAWLMFIAVISGSCIAITFYRYSRNYFYSVFLFLTYTTFTWMMNGIRQFLVVAILFACTPLIVKRKWLLYTLVVLLCSTIHGSCIIMIPIYFVVQGKPWKVKSMVSIIAVLIIVAFASSFTNMLDMALSGTAYGEVGQSYLGDDGAHPLRVLVYSVPTIIALLGRRILAKKGKEIDVMVNMSIITTELYLVAMATSGIMMGRLPIYTQMYGYMLLPYLIETCFTPRSRRFLYIASIVCFVGYFFLMSQGFYYSSEITGRLY